MTEPPSVTVLIPARNEEADIERCLQAVLAQDYPHSRMQIVLVDGGSSDSTAAAAAKVLADGDVEWRILDNPTGTTPSNLNLGLAAATGEVLCRVDARSIIPPEYVRLSTSVLSSRPDVVVTGGAQVAVPTDTSARAVGIARALNNRYAMGGSRYRIGIESGPTDTVYLGVFRVSQLREVAGWDERMLTNQDFDLNRRLGRRGVVWFDSGLKVGYRPRRTIRALGQQYHRFGRWKARYWRLTGEPPRFRQLVPLMAAPMLVAAAAVSVRRIGPGAFVRTAVTVGATALLVVDAAGNKSPSPVEARIVGSVATSTVAAAWVTGVYRELIAATWHGPAADHS